jgi:hypothetical protein
MMRIYLLYILTIFYFSSVGQNYLLEEHFDYDEETEIRANGWTPHSAGGTNPLKVTAPGLNLINTPYIGGGVGNAVAVNNTGSDENKPFEKDINEGSVYAAFLLKPGEAVSSDGSGVFFHFVTYSNSENPDYTSISTAFRSRTSVAPGSSDAFFRIGLTFNTAAVPTDVGVNLTEDLDISKTYLVVVKYTFVAGDDNDEVSIFIFEDGDDISEEPATPTLGPYGGTAADASILQGVALRQYNAAQNIIVDGIFVSNEWDFEKEDDPVSINQVAESQIRIYPNPTQVAEINIVGISDVNSVINITDISGKTVAQQNMNNSGVISLNGLNAGIYFIQIINGAQVHTQKLIIQ